PWYAAMTLEHGTGYLHGFFVGDNLERFATDRFNEPRPLWFYLPIVAGGLMPWTPFALLWIRPIRHWISSPRRLDPRVLRLTIWILLPLVFFSVSVGKQPRYIMPALVPLAILLGAAIAEALETRRPGAAMRVATGLTAASLLALALLLWRVRSLAVDTPVVVMAIACGAIAAAGSAILIHLRSRASRALPFTVAGAAVVTLLALHYSVLSSAGPEPVERVADLVRSQRTGSEPTATHHLLVRNLVFYTRFPSVDLVDPARLAVFLESSDRVLCVLPAHALHAYETPRSKRLRRLAEVPYFNVSTVKLKALVWPDPNADLETIVVVSNK
ncbi:MAG: hypothetical protein HY654_05795, partial [Acidobacteria bacterium]|nr:hypothetical protein [Acidobacteriota bacterium]